jgi:EAL domain-containing protein (putative c-di-GMP-specific phosphodiesterase class I)
VAVANSELEMHYQPIIRLGDGVVVGFEALMRWEHAERGYISPELFIPIAEETNLINDLGEWALRRACAEAVKWPQSVRVAVNVSAVQFINNAFPVMVGNALQESGLDAARLELELTESIFLGDQDFTEGTFATLKGLGVRLALDDFGTGYSSLSYLRSAPFDNIKIDRCFVEECAQRDKNSAKIIAAIIGLAEALGMETTIEGVEAFDQLEVVRAMGARFIQGYIYSRPLKNEEIVARMESGLFRIEPDGPSRHRADRRSVFLRIRMIYDGHRHEAVMRELSKTGARLEGVYGIPEGAALVLDLGSGQLVECIVIHAKGAIVGVEFDQALVNDGAGGLCTRQRVPPNGVAEGGRVARVLAAAKMAQ